MYTSILHKIIARAGAYILRLTYIQIVLAFVYIPVLVYWGIPVSCMSIPGNIICAPFFIACIVCAFFIFFLELFYVPNSLFCMFFEYITYYWTALLTRGSPTWLIGFANPGIFYLVLFMIAGIISLIISRMWRPLPRIFCVGATLVVSMVLLKYLPHLPATHTITYKKKSCVITHNNGTLCLTINHNGLRKKNFAKWFNTVIKKELYTIFGRGTVDTVKLSKPTKHTSNIVRENKEIIGYQELIINSDY